MANRLSLIETIFFRALEKGDPRERNALLDEECGDDNELRVHIQRLLDAHGKVDKFLEDDAADVVVTKNRSVADKAGTVIGQYKLLQQIGEGGFGVVFMAEQMAPIRRKVAVKVIKPGMDTKEVIARFEAERQALALMDHPNIARVLDAGATTEGRPYFVMELVKGVPITEYCDTTNLSTRQRLELFQTVCRAIQHAHQKGIIHRDIKPSNVMITLHDGIPVPKIIDFGVSKAINQLYRDVEQTHVRICRKLGDPQGAAEVLQSGISLRQAALPANHPDIASAKLDLADVLAECNKHEEAAQVLAEAESVLLENSNLSDWNKDRIDKRVVELRGRIRTSDPAQADGEHAGQSAPEPVENVTTSLRERDDDGFANGDRVGD